MKESYSALAFDVDGTLTPFARFTVSKEMKQSLQNIPLQVPLALCTGRPFDYAVHKIEELLEGAADFSDQRARWTLLCDNGASGYTWNASTQTYENFFAEPWPADIIEQDLLLTMLQDEFGSWAQIIVREFTMVVLCPQWMYHFPPLVHWYAGRLRQKLEKYFKAWGLTGQLCSQNSGLGNLIFSGKAGKGKAVEKWAKRLGVPTDSIACVGDRPEPGGNDEEFLSGKYGTAFTVGEATKNPQPYPVLDAQGKAVRGPKGTQLLISQISLRI
jgi:hydroxymethylpyrimidine pyrophosphatase-like HAD family hydrolase